MDSPSKIAETLELSFSFEPLITLDESVPLFEKSFEYRTDQENLKILSLLKSFSLFQPPSEDTPVHLEILNKLCRYEFLTKGQALSHSGENPMDFWIILKGNIRRYIPKQREEVMPNTNNSNKFVPALKQLNEVRDRLKTDNTNDDLSSIEGTPRQFRKSSVRPSRSFRVPKKDKDGVTIEIPEEVEIFRKFDMNNKYFSGVADSFTFKMDNVFTPGWSSIKSIPRGLKKPCSGTLVAWCDTHILSININDFLQELKEHEKFVQNRIACLRNVFPELSKHIIIYLLSIIEKKILRIGETIFNEDSECTELYILQKGEVELSKNWAIDGITSRDQKIKTNRTKNYKAPVVILPEGQLLGEEMLLDYKTRIFTAKVKTSEAVLYVVPMALFHEIGRFKVDILYAFNQKAKSSVDSKITMLSKIQTEVKATLSLFQEPTSQEKAEIEHFKNKLDYFKRELLQERITSIGDMTPHITSPWVEQDGEMSQQKLQKLATIKTHAHREITKNDPRYDSEEASPPPKELKTSVYFHSPKSSKPFEALSIWTEAAKGSHFQKKLKIFQKKHPNAVGPTSYRASCEPKTEISVKNEQVNSARTHFELILSKYQQNSSPKKLSDTKNPMIGHNYEYTSSQNWSVSSLLSPMLSKDRSNQISTKTLEKIVKEDDDIPEVSSENEINEVQFLTKARKLVGTQKSDQKKHKIRPYGKSWDLGKAGDERVSPLTKSPKYPKLDSINMIPPETEKNKNRMEDKRDLLVQEILKIKNQYGTYVDLSIKVSKENKLKKKDKSNSKKDNVSLEESEITGLPKLSIGSSNRKSNNNLMSLTDPRCKLSKIYSVKNLSKDAK